MQELEKEVCRSGTGKKRRATRNRWTNLGNDGSPLPAMGSPKRMPLHMPALPGVRPGVSRIFPLSSWRPY